MNLRRLKSINIFGKPFRITWCRTMEDVDPNPDDGGPKAFLGVISNDRQEIRLYRGMPLETLWETLMHEIIHAIQTEMGLGSLRREQAVRCLATALADTLVRNKLMRLE